MSDLERERNTNTSSEAPSLRHEQRRRLKWGLIFTATLFAVMGGALVYAVLYTPLGIPVYLALNQNAGHFDRGHFETIVAEVRKLNLEPGEVRDLRLDDPSDPTSLRPVRDLDIGPGNGVGNVWAEVTRSGKLKVVIQTRDLNHAGSFGFAYSDEPLTPRPFGWGDGDWQELDVPGFLNMVLPEMRIDEHWWRVEYNLG